eukprot:6186526-Pleurochrysis_carterae.AAC.1
MCIRDSPFPALRHRPRHEQTQTRAHAYAHDHARAHSQEHGRAVRAQGKSLRARDGQTAQTREQCTAICASVSGSAETAAQIPKQQSRRVRRYLSTQPRNPSKEDRMYSNANTEQACLLLQLWLFKGLQIAATIIRRAVLVPFRAAATHHLDAHLRRDDSGKHA